MINNWKLGVKSLKYAYGIKTNIFMAVVFIGFGIACYIFGGKMDVGLLGDYMLICVNMLPVQMIYSLNASNIVASSPAGKKLQTSVPAVIACSGMALVYLIMAAIRGIMAWRHPERIPGMAEELIGAALIMLGIMAYMGIAYKYFYLSMVLLIGVIVVLAAPSLSRGEFTISLPVSWFQDGWGLAAAIAAGLAIIMAGGLLQYLISCLCYRRPLSKMAQPAPLRAQL